LAKLFKGSVGIEQVRGRLRLRLPRQLYGGKQKYLSLGLPDKPDYRKFAELKARQVEMDILTGQFDPTLNKYKPQTYCVTDEPKTKPVAEIALDELWRRFTAFKSPSIAQSTLATDYEKAKHLIAALPTKAIADAVAIRDLLLSTHSPNAAKRYLVKLSACCEWAVKSGLIGANPFKGMAKDIKLPRSSAEVQIESFSASERDRIIEAFRQSKDYSFYADFVEFLFFTGCRPSEAIALEWKHISPGLITFEQAATISRQGISIKPGLKTQSWRKFPVNYQVDKILVRLERKKLERKGYLFLSPHGHLIDFHNFRNRAWSSIFKNLDIPYKKPYATRHTFITLCLEAGIDAKDIAQWVGNSADMIYKHYAGTNLMLNIPEL
jgi:integrase